MNLGFVVHLCFRSTLWCCSPYTDVKNNWCSCFWYQKANLSSIPRVLAQLGNCSEEITILLKVQLPNGRFLDFILVGGRFHVCLKQNHTGCLCFKSSQISLHSHCGYFLNACQTFIIKVIASAVSSAVKSVMIVCYEKCDMWLDTLAIV